MPGKHTPLPWSEGGDESSNRIDIEGPAPEYRIVATLGSETPRRKADAALILRAVNAQARGAVSVTLSVAQWAAVRSALSSSLVYGNEWRDEGRQTIRTIDHAEQGLNAIDVALGER